MPDEQPTTIEQRLARLEATVARLAQIAGMPEERAAERAAARANATFVAVPTHEAHVSVPELRTDAEGFFGGRVLLAGGAITLLLGIAFFIKYAFDNGWIGPSGRVAIGMIAGIALVAAGQRFERTSTALFAGVLTGLGGGVLYLSLWAAGSDFHLVPIVVSFSAMAVVTVALLALALQNDSQVTAAFALFGGFITPLLNLTDVPNFFNLLAYIAILDLLLVLLPINRRWPVVQIGAFIFTQLYLLSAFGSTHGSPISTYLAFATIFLAIFLVQPVRKAMAGVGMTLPELAVTVAATTAYYVALHAELFEEHRHWLTAAVIVLAAVFVVLARISRSRDRLVFASIALALITGGVAITFTRNIVVILWAIEGALLTWAGLRQNQRPVRLFGLVGLGLAICGALMFPPPGGPAIFNERFATFVVFAIALFSVRLISQRYKHETGEQEAPLYTFAEPAGHICLLYALSYEAYNMTHGYELSLTLLWLVYAAALFAYGFTRGNGLVRGEALALLSIAILKAFIIDMSAVNPGVRIVSFIALGSAMLGISYVYTQNAKKAKQTL